MDSNKTLNYAIWITVIGGGLFFLYKKFGKGDTKALKSNSLSTLEEVQAKYPNWNLEKSKTTGKDYYSKNFWTLNQDGSKFKEMWFIFYHNNIWRIYTRETPEKLISSGTYTSPNKLTVTQGFNEGNTFKKNNLAQNVSDILNQKVSDLPTN